MTRNRLERLLGAVRCAVQLAARRRQATSAGQPARERPTHCADKVTTEAGRPRNAITRPPEATAALDGQASTHAPLQVVDGFFAGLGMHGSPSIDVALVRSLITRDLALGDPGAEWVRARLEQVLANKESLGSFLVRTKKNLADKHPALVCFLAEADLAGFVADPGIREMAHSVLHHAYVLDTVVELMIDDCRFAAALDRSLRAAHRRRNINLARMAKICGLFGPVKYLSIAAAMSPITGLGRIRKMDRLSAGDFLLWKFGVSLNILEAAVTEASRGHVDNAIVGLRLAKITAHQGRIDGAKREMKLAYPKGWASLYTLWNLGFLLHNLPDPHQLIAKLLIPAVAAAPDETYAYRRTLALWVTTCTYVIQQAENHPTPVIRLDRPYLARLTAHLTTCCVRHQRQWAAGLT